MSFWADLGKALFGIGKGALDERKRSQNERREAEEAARDTSLELDLREARRRRERGE